MWEGVPSAVPLEAGFASHRHLNRSRVDNINI
jgi:hypothetical protein